MKMLLVPTLSAVTIVLVIAATLGMARHALTLMSAPPIKMTVTLMPLVQTLLVLLHVLVKTISLGMESLVLQVATKSKCYTKGL